MVVAQIAWMGGSVAGLIGMGAVGCCCQQQQQQQQILETGDEEPKRVCPDCGMENPREADHCGDCGFGFKSNDTTEYTS